MVFYSNDIAHSNVAMCMSNSIPYHREPNSPYSRNSIYRNPLDHKTRYNSVNRPS